ncbi:cyclic nucleotide-binding domain-containing protein [Desulfolutivibrio sulfoxidireducens]|uniref:cyclic nucleotide-binding domain-containing protein n=1 Tax=Desulfolutivibrio sulfoxidireducens TaxID=2773299 RepID=UPI00159E05CB|nr:cyclic nucleotide-binding domain-containing protein [Desulfolutivibrio sulfoxidireducens]QLA16419.1 cyclic nucleotide-binding domain-containing protein [Desulfolutivibrio sulfoxidireducens]QLA19700.1 cyclic nucleotide-binding domain-containing protein [Desulfolutivibrio sulfoxidireducens]
MPEAVGELLLTPEIGRRICEMLDESAWARDLTWPDIQALSDYMTILEFPKHATIFSEGDTSDYMTVVLDGVVEIVKHEHDDEYSTKFLVRLGPGRAFGEMALVEGRPRSATALAAEDTRLLVLSREAFDRLSRENKSLALKMAMNIARLISFRLRHTSSRLLRYL